MMSWWKALIVWLYLNRHRNVGEQVSDFAYVLIVVFVAVFVIWLLGC